MSITCTITKAGRFDEYGRPLTVAQSYTGADSFVQSLVQSGYASVSSVDVFGPSALNDIRLTQAQYDAIPVKDPNTLYVIVG